jgi:hypothetical protein
MLLDLDGGLDDLGVEGVRNEGDDQVVLADLLLERIRVGDVEGDGAGVLETLGEGFGAGEGAAGFEAVSTMLFTHVGDEVNDRINQSGCQCLPTVTWTPALSSSTAVGLVTKPAPRSRTL